MRPDDERDPLGYHLTLRCEDNRVIATTDAQRRAVARSVIGAARDHRITSFGLVDTHLHLVNVEDWQRCGRLGQRVATSIKRTLALPVGFAPVYREPIRSQRHLENSFYYDLRQQDHHGVVTDTYHDGSNLPDLLGLRVLGRSLATRVRALLPRVNRKRLLDVLGLEELPEEAPVDWALLPTAAAAAACLPDLSGHGREARQARDAAIQVALGAGLKTAAVAEILRVTSRCVQIARGRLVPAELLRAVRLQLILRKIKRPASNGI